MKKSIFFLFIILLLSLIVFLSCNVSADSVEITSCEPTTVTSGVGTDFTVDVNYTLETFDSATLKVSVFYYEGDVGAGQSYDNVIVDKGTSEHTFQFNATVNDNPNNDPYIRVTLEETQSGGGGIINTLAKDKILLNFE